MLELKTATACLSQASFFTHLLEIGDRDQILHLSCCQFVAELRSTWRNLPLQIISNRSWIWSSMTWCNAVKVVLVDAGTVEAGLWFGASRWSISEWLLWTIYRLWGTISRNLRALKKNGLLSVVIKTFPFVVQSAGQCFWPALLQTLCHLRHQVWGFIQRPICSFISSFWFPGLCWGQCFGNYLRNVQFL